MKQVREQSSAALVEEKSRARILSKRGPDRRSGSTVKREGRNQAGTTAQRGTKGYESCARGATKKTKARDTCREKGLGKKEDGQGRTRSPSPSVSNIPLRESKIPGG